MIQQTATISHVLHDRILEFLELSRKRIRHLILPASIGHSGAEMNVRHQTYIEKVTVLLHDYLLTGNLLSRILRSCLPPSSG